jgi:hypothetical protein
MREFARRHETLRGEGLIAEAYRRYPYYATRSEIAGGLLADDALALAAIDAERPQRRGARLFTIGYEGSSLEGYFNRLLRAGMTILCDVRRNPFSHKYGFSKGTLSKTCEGLGIRYEHLPELGIEPSERRDLNTQSDYDALFAVYRSEKLPHQAGALGRIVSWLREGHRVALTCFEQLPQQCHRHCIADALARTDCPGGAPRHI